MSKLRRRGSNKHKSFGLTAEVNRKIQSKYDTELEMQCRDWLEKMLGENIEWGVETEYSRPGESFADGIFDGIVLCRVMNEVFPGAISKIHGINGGRFHGFQILENIEKFLKACQGEPFNCNVVDLFSPGDLYEKNNVGQVITGIQAFARKAHQYDKTVPLFGPKEAEKNPRNFPEQKHFFRGDI
ncbi:predicted protein [Nematostella vectensis]|uniref:Calponin-homology (CH) domain-containing protein n=2 Tax=Nematostella vectensis TaxID=45351 RepID=A7RPE5_NEMVE|nr:predicted protein [Nematostella vectensis]|eukprot:XP_001638786.1 predicted protein [Nematostella vectensis]